MGGFPLRISAPEQWARSVGWCAGGDRFVDEQRQKREPREQNRQQQEHIGEGEDHAIVRVFLRAYQQS